MREMKVWPFGAAIRVEASNRHMLHWLKTVVVNDVEKASVRCQVGTRKMSKTEPLLTCRYKRSDIKTVVCDWLRDKSGGCPSIGQAVSGMEAA